MTACQRHWIPDPETFNALGYNWSAIQRVADADLTAIPEGAPLPSKKQELDMVKQQEAINQQNAAVEMQSNIIAKTAETKQQIIDNMS